MASAEDAAQANDRKRKHIDEVTEIAQASKQALLKRIERFDEIIHLIEWPPLCIDYSSQRVTWKLAGLKSITLTTNHKVPIQVKDSEGCIHLFDDGKEALATVHRLLESDAKTHKAKESVFKCQQSYAMMAKFTKRMINLLDRIEQDSEWIWPIDKTDLLECTLEFRATSGEHIEAQVHGETYSHDLPAGDAYFSNDLTEFCKHLKAELQK